MNKPWFGKRRLGWGWGLPLRWQGWLTLAIFIAFLASLSIFTTNLKVFIPLVVLAIIIFSIVARITSGKPEWNDGKDYAFDKRAFVALCTVIVAIVVIAGVSQIAYLRKAHSTFENYYQFRGCVELLEKTDTSATCRLASGKTITIVEINNKWYLQGDGPGMF